MFWNILYVILDLFLTPTKKSGYSLRGFFGEIKHFNKHGVQIGYSLKNFWGGRNRYDMNGNLVSYTLKSFWGGYDTYDARGNLIRKSRRNFWGGYNTYDRKGTKVRESYRDFWGGMNHFDIEDSDNMESFTIERKNVSRNKMKSDITKSRNTSQRVNNSTTFNKNNTVSKRQETSGTNTIAKKNKESSAKESISKASVNNTRQDKNSNSKIVVRDVPVAQYHQDISNKNDKIQQEIKDKKSVDVDSVISYKKDSTGKSKLSDKKVEYYSSIEEYINTNNIAHYVKVLALEYEDMLEFPAIAYRESGMIKVVPLVNDVDAFELKESEIKNAKRVCVEGLDMDVMDNEFLNLSLSSLGKEYEELLPDYSFDMDGISRIQYVFECGLIITEKSMKVLDEGLC